MGCLFLCDVFIKLKMLFEQMIRKNGLKCVKDFIEVIKSANLYGGCKRQFNVVKKVKNLKIIFLRYFDTFPIVV